MFDFTHQAHGFVKGWRFCNKEGATAFKTEAISHVCGQ